MRKILIKNLPINKFYIVYDGPETENHRKEYRTIEELIEKISHDLNLNPKKSLKIELKGYSNKENYLIKEYLNSKFKKVQYYNK
ncbi:MAG TPA: hypothetical protein P5277_00305 [Candidatus Paceibacterota bacterium]|nr:hypothetical protein [Candidatus Paceibacterota bacterium]